MTNQLVTPQPNAPRPAAHGDRVAVIIVLEGETLSEVRGGRFTRLSQQIALSVMQSALIQTIQHPPYDAENIRITQYVLNSVMAVVNADSLPSLHELPNVRTVSVDQQLTPNDGGVGGAIPDSNTMRQPVERPTTVNE